MQDQVNPSLDQGDSTSTLEDDAALGAEPDADEQRQVEFWRTRITSARKEKHFENYKKDRDAAKKFYFGEQMTKDEIDNWGGDLVQANLFVRTVNFMTDSVYNQDPAIRCPARSKSRSNPKYQAWSAAIEHHLVYLFEEQDLAAEVRRVVKDCFFGNLATAEVDFDRERGLFRFKWIAGDVICDPDAYGDLRRARWFAKMVQLPRYRVWQDQTFDADAREEMRGRQTDGSGVEGYLHDDDDKENRKDVETLWYVWSKEGVMPLENEDDGTRWRLLVFAEGLNQWLLNVEEPCPYLDNDEFPVEIMQVDEAPGYFRGPALWRRIEAVCKAFNWAASYHMEDMRKTATRPIGYNEDKIVDPDTLTSRKHMTPVACQGDPKDAVAPLNIGGADKTIYNSVNFWYDMLDKLMGIDEIARGEEGKTKTATESQILQQNSSIALSGPSKALDRFLNGIIRKIALATLYYMPAYSVYVNQAGQVVTRAMQMVPQMPPAVPGAPPAPAMPMGPGSMPQMVQQLVEVPARLRQDQAVEYGLEVDAAGTVKPMPDMAGQHLIKGADYFHGDELAANWPQVDFDQVKNDLAFEIEAGSSRASMRLEKQRNAQSLLQTVGAQLYQLQLWDYYYEILNTVVESFELNDKDKLFPPKDKFVQAMQVQQQMAMMAAQMGGGAQGGAAQQRPGGPAAQGAQPNDFNAAKNEGKKFPLGPAHGGR